MRIIAGARQNLFDLACGVADDVGFSRFKIDRAAFVPGLQQYLKQVVQVLQMRHECTTLGRFRATGITQNGGHFGISKTRSGVNHGRIELIRVDFAFGVDDCVTD